MNLNYMKKKVLIIINFNYFIYDYRVELNDIVMYTNNATFSKLFSRAQSHSPCLVLSIASLMTPYSPR